MASKARLKRKSFFIDEIALQRARRILGAKTDAEVIRLSVERMAELEAFWQFVNKSRGTLGADSIEVP